MDDGRSKGEREVGREREMSEQMTEWPKAAMCRITVLHNSGDAIHIVLPVMAPPAAQLSGTGQGGRMSEGDAVMWPQPGKPDRTCRGPSIFLLWLEESRGREVRRGRNTHRSVHILSP